jgi:hypothetical protein
MRRAFAAFIFAVSLGGTARAGDQDGSGVRWVDRLRDSLSSLLSISGTPGQYQSFATPQAAASAAGIPVLLPAANNQSLVAGASFLISDRATTVTANLQALNGGVLGLVTPLIAGVASETPDPRKLMVTITATSIVLSSYMIEGNTVYLAQSPCSDVFVPEAVRVPLLTELRLILMGVPPEAAWRYANDIDWRSAMLVQVPASISGIQEVDLNGHRGLLISSKPVAARPVTRVVLWSSGQQLLGLQGTIDAATIIAIARSVQ